MKPVLETVAVIGAGAVGAAYGSLIHRVRPGRVCLIADGERGARLQRDGVVVNGVPYLFPVVAPQEARPTDLVVVAVKHYDLDEAIAYIRGVVGEETTIISVLNGIDSEERIAAVYGWNRVLYSLNLGIDALRLGNRIDFQNQGRLFFGEAKNPAGGGERLLPLRQLCEEAGIVYEVPTDMIRTLWFKFMVNVGVNQVSAVLRASYGEFQKTGRARELMNATMSEVIRLANTLGIDLGEGDMAAWHDVLVGLNPRGKTSMLQDVEAGRRTEVEMLAGTVIQLGRRHKVPTPLNEWLYGEIRAIERTEGPVERGGV